MIAVKAIIFPALLLLSVNAARNNVCKHLLDYITIDFNKNCWYNPDVGATPEQLITGHGYPFESYSLVTEDGYILDLFRMPHNNIDTSSNRQPILLHHGILSTSMSAFVSIGNRSLAFFFSDNGFDVWLANPRGSPYSLGHLNLSISDAKYWGFSFHEIGLYDLPTAIDFIAEKTKSSGNIILLGHSMGTTAGFVYSILKKEHAERHLAGIIAFSPISYMTNIRGIAAVAARYAGIIEFILKILKIHVLFGPRDFYTYATYFINSKFPFIISSEFSMSLGAGFDLKQVNVADLPVILSLSPASTSIKTIEHYAQEINNKGKFQFYDYGRRKNLELYKSVKPPEYNVSEIEIPVYLFYGKADFLSNEKDSTILYNNLLVKDKLLTSIPINNKKIKFNHVDFTYAKNIEEFLYKPLIKLVNEKLRRV